ncbi:uncharacterized protein LOC120664049 isoform X2 [Panicum virgatum]|uniref:uncharacterized protein LOC120664049 isoform X2 n=1 Tax=Panicum virgatum TaxID=38727 RepID=UPI0019D5C124|nr:uncharacterized protein LOC120664049 isoform X2 [Panicum virgatum]XP_039798951.1 uncharacterized protein LOC120664049 isoform X2 [Panicum virgatum]
MECACLAWVQMLGGKGWCSARGVGVRELLWKLLLLLASSSSAAAGIYQSQRVVGHRVALSAPWRSRGFAAMDGPDVAPKGRPSTPAWIWQNHGPISAAALAHRQSPRDPLLISQVAVVHRIKDKRMTYHELHDIDNEISRSPASLHQFDTKGDRISSIQAKQGQGSPSEDRDHDNAAGIQTTIPYPAEVAESIYQVENIPVKHGDDEDGPYQEMDTAWKRSSGFSRGASIY